MTPKISVIIPFYNVEKYFAECLDSVLAQSYSNLEIICVDDNGTDGSRAIADSYAARDSRIRILTLDGNKGIGPARNAGMDAMTGDYFFFLDSDDILTENAIETLYETLVRTGADMVAGRYEAFADENLPELRSSVRRLTSTFSLTHDSDVKVDIHNFQNMLDASYGVVWGKLYSAKYMRRKNIRFHDSNILHEDKGFWLKCIGSLPHYASTSKVVLRYRIRANSSMTNATKEQKNQRKLDIRLSVKDGIKHLYAMHSHFVARELHKQTRSHHSYALQLNSSYLGGLLHLRWYEHEKYVGIFFIELYREKIRRDGIKIYRLLGIVLRKKRIFQMGQKTAILLSALETILY